jgi:UDP-N-acetyl-D-galactosamine dehydrogenase
VDPYYLTYKAEVAGHHPQVILAGRRINDIMGRYVARQTIKHMAALGRPVTGAKVLVLGLVFKEDCADIRNSRVADLVAELRSYGAQPVVCDPLADAGEAHHEYGIELMEFGDVPKVQAIVAAVPHRQFRALKPGKLAALKAASTIPFMDVKSAFDRKALESQGFKVWRL